MKKQSVRKISLLLAGLLLIIFLATACRGTTPAETSSESLSEFSSVVSEATLSEDGISQESTPTDSVNSKSSGSGSALSSKTVTSKGNKYGLPEINVKTKTLRLYTGPEKKLTDYYSKTSIPGAIEIASEVYGIKLELVSCGDYNDWYSKLATLVLSDNAPDIAYPPAETFPYDIVKNNIIALDKVLDFKLPMWDDVRPLLSEYSWNNTHYHAVINNGKLMQPVYYNPKLFKANGIETPKEYMKKNNWTWDTMRQIAVELTQDTNGDGVVDQWGVGGMFFTALQESTGARLVEVKGKDVKLNISDPVFAKAAQYIYDLGQKGKYKCAKAFSHDNADLFLAGDVAMDVGSPWRASETYLGLWSKGLVDLVPFPKMDKNSSYYAGGVPTTLVVYRGSKNVDAAKAFIYSAKYVTTDSYKKMFAKELKNIKPMSYLLEKGLTDEQRAAVASIYENDYPSNPNTWIGWLDNGYDCGFQYAHEKQWSTILNLYTNKFNSNIKKFKETLEVYTE